MEDDDRKSYSVDDALSALGFGKFQVLVLMYAGMGWVSEAMEMMLLSFVGPAVQSLWDLSSQQESLITSVVFAGMMLGAYSWGVVSDIYGRRKGFLITAIITSTAGFLSAFSPNLYVLVIFRGLVGIGLGGGPVLSSWFLEFIPASERGAWMVVFSSFWTLGTVLEASIAWFVMPRLGWRWLLALSALPSSLLLLLYRVTPESPRYLCMVGRKSDALAILEKIARVNGRKLPSGILVTDNQVELEDKSSEDTKLIPSTKNDLDAGSRKSGISLLIMLLSPELVRSTLLLWMVFFGNAFAYYGLVLLTTELNNNHNRCEQKGSHSVNQQEVNYRDIFITSFAEGVLFMDELIGKEFILIRDGRSIISERNANFISYYLLQEFPGLLLSAATVDKVGRKVSMATMFFFCFVFLMPLVVQQPQSLTTCLLFGARVCITGTFTIVYIYAPELYPTSVRTTGVGVASSVGRIGGMICPVVAVGLVHGCKQSTAVFLFESIVFVSGVCVYLLPFETRGLELSNNVSSSKHNHLDVSL